MNQMVDCFFFFGVHVKFGDKNMHNHLEECMGYWKCNASHTDLMDN